MFLRIWIFIHSQPLKSSIKVVKDQFNSFHCTAETFEPVASFYTFFSLAPAWVLAFKLLKIEEDIIHAVNCRMDFISIRSKTKLLVEHSF